MKVSFIELFFTISYIMEDNDLKSAEELFNYLQENGDLFLMF